MKKDEFQTFTQKDYKFIPKNVLIVKNMYGWTFMHAVGAQWYVNSTNDQKDCPPEDNEKFLKKLVAGIKQQMKLI